MTRAYAARGEPDPTARIGAFLAECGTSGAELVAGLARELDVEPRMLAAGPTEDDVTALRRGLLDPPPW